MKKTIALAITFVSAASFSQPIMTLSEIVSFMSTNDYRRNFIMTNSLDALIATSTSVQERASCKLLKASILLDQSENMADAKSFVQVTNLCCEVEEEMSGSFAWQRIGSLSIFANAMIDDEHPEVAFAASTNLLSIFNGNQCSVVDTNLWDVLFRSGGLSVMTPLQFIKANAAASRLRMDKAADISLYTN